LTNCAEIAVSWAIGDLCCSVSHTHLSIGLHCGKNKALFPYVGSRGNFDLSLPVCVMAVLLSGAEVAARLCGNILLIVIIKYNLLQWHTIINEDEDGRLQQSRERINNFSGQRYVFYGDFRLKYGL